ncbi:glycosyltransferase family 4 protein [Tolypothrix sp. FACHB-123]|uniref:glycosyltransferase family 4 protein n=1 Tax=Tolypothrix sp. FACHB-123 TaxID=2692868 RepID=UPI0016876F05|nr:glycosyltransferase family 4 protein [Tolypothrix sp. FACHB-123]MBD2355802.1 glycosyltransferase family 4 protein [Tolypothrix sp. FACHB-123]
MRILTIHNRYQIKGGEDECFEAEVNLLRQMGHEVEIYEENNDKVAVLGKLNIATRTVWSDESYQTVKGLLASKPFDVVHVHNFFPIVSPSVYYAAKTEGVPVVQTLHNYRLLCPNALFFRDGQVCEDCLGQFIPYSGVVHGCYRDSKVASGGVATMLTVHRLMATWSKTVDLYIALTEFARQKFIAGGLPAEKIVVKPNFVSLEPTVGNGCGGYALFVGRLSVEKGLDTILQAWEHLGTQIPLKIVGDGPLADQVLAAAKTLPQVEWLGRKTMSEVHDLMGEAMFLVFPSKWYETFGRVAIEAFAKGTPVIAANIGAIAELVDSGRTGLHFRPGDADDLTAKVKWLLANPSNLSQMRQQARAEFETKYTAVKNYQRMMEIYLQAQATSTSDN